MSARQGGLSRAIYSTAPDAILVGEVPGDCERLWSYARGWSDGRRGTWKDPTGDNQTIRDSVFVPPAGLVVLRQR